MNKQEQEALKRIKESLCEFPDNFMAQYIRKIDLEILVKMVEKCVKK
jgi:hypothetical protein